MVRNAEDTPARGFRRVPGEAEADGGDPPRADPASATEAFDAPWDPAPPPADPRPPWPDAPPVPADRGSGPYPAPPVPPGETASRPPWPDAPAVPGSNDPLGSGPRPRPPAPGANRVPPRQSGPTGCQPCAAQASEPDAE